MTKVWRADIRDEKMRLEVNMQMAFFIVQGLREQAEEIRAEIKEHEDVCGEEPSYCQIRYQSLIAEYGTIEEAVKQTGVVLYDCMENLSDMHMTLGQIMQTIHRMNILLRNPEAAGEDPDKTDWRPIDKLREIEREASYRTEVGKAETGLMPVIDENTGKDASASILGLTEQLPQIGATPTKSAKAKTTNGEQKEAPAK